MKILLTGSTGFIGWHLAEALVEAGHETYCAVRKPDEAAQCLPKGALAVPISEILEGHFPFSRGEALVHLAAIRHRWGASDEEYLSANVDLTKRLLDRSTGKIEQFVYCSSIAVFGWPRKGPIDESFPYAPLNAYGKSKVRCEHMLLKHRQQGKIKTTIVRPSITYGRRDPTGMLTKLAMLIEQGRYATVGSGDNRVQLAHVQDIVQGFMKTLGNPRAYGQSYIVTAQAPIRINRLVEMVAQTMGRPCPRWKIPRWLATLAALGLEAGYALGLRVTGREPIIAREKIQVMTTDRHYSIARAREELDYAPQYDYSNGIEDFVRGLRQDGLLRAGEA